MAEPSFREAFLYWLKLGFINFGGPTGQIAIMHRDLVEKRRWISEERFLHALNFCMMLPGPEAQQLAIYVGWRLHRTWGGIVAGSLFVLPSVAVLLALAWFYWAYGTVPLVAAAFLGIQAVILAIVAHAVVRIGKRALRGAALVAVAAAAFLALAFLRAPFPLVILAAAALGAALPRVFGAAQEQPVERAPAPPARRVWIILGVGALLWGIPLALLVASRQGVLVDAALFFSKLALVTFGGAYAVLAYMAQQAVQSYHWLSAQDMIAGLGLAESTPGPLIMVVCFVGFLAGAHAGGALLGVAGGLVAVYFTFLFSFLLIFLGAPYIERLRGNRALAAALRAITAAVVGVILSLALFLARGVLMRDGALQWFPAALALVAFGLLTWLDLDVLVVVLGGAGTGLLAHVGGLA